MAFVYRLATGMRNAAFDSGVLRAHRLAARVVSVGNLTVGGTGKTPLVARLVAEARQAGRWPGVLARGYGRAPGAELNDEGQLLARRFPDLPQVQDPDRVRGGQKLLELCADPAVDLILLDDGFQHRRLARDFDIVCVDALHPFSSGGLLPAGNLREAARSGLARAGSLVLTRADRLTSADQVEGRIQQLRELAGREDLPVHPSRHAPSGLLPVVEGGGEPRGLDSLKGRRVVLVSAIARPGSFRETVESLGAEVRAEVVFKDHHRYRSADVETIERRLTAESKAVGGEVDLLTTEKDAVKLRDFGARMQHAWALQVTIEWMGPPPTAAQLGLV